jgi:hypothetical protein
LGPYLFVAFSEPGDIEMKEAEKNMKGGVLDFLSSRI